MASKPLTENDVEISAAYVHSITGIGFVLLSKHKDVGYVRFEDGNYGYVKYSEMEQGQ